MPFHSTLLIFLYRTGTPCKYNQTFAAVFYHCGLVGDLFSYYGCPALPVFDAALARSGESQTGKSSANSGARAVDEWNDPEIAHLLHIPRFDTVELERCRARLGDVTGAPRGQPIPRVSCCEWVLHMSSIFSIELSGVARVLESKSARRHRCRWQKETLVLVPSSA